jgi:alkaline phosphatase D
MVSEGPYFGNGVRNGWVDQHTITLWTRLTKKPEMNTEGKKFIDIGRKLSKELAKKKDEELLMNSQMPKGLTLEDMEGATPGAYGEVKLSYYYDNYSNRIQTEWLSVDSTQNFTQQWKLSGLLANSEYHIELLSRKGVGYAVADTLQGSFTTAPDPATIKPIKFSVVSCHDYNRRDSSNGHKIYPSMEKDSLDFFVHTGDVEYYDKPNPYSLTEALMRFKWNRLFALPLQRDFYNKTTSYFMKDDHDVLQDDAYKGMEYGMVSFERGLEIFDKEQFPSNDKPYKTIRWGKDLQVWLLEGRNYRSKNTDPDGPEKTILGKVQKEWLFSTINASDATYKIIISPSPILGPDRPNGKNDNLSNKAFQYEGDILREFIDGHDNVYVCTGDRHWQFATHFEGTNLWEFGSGAGADIHAGGWKQDNILPQHRFLRVKGGYLLVDVYHENNEVKLKFSHCDVDGKVVHEEIFSKKAE